MHLWVGKSRRGSVRYMCFGVYVKRIDYVKRIQLNTEMYHFRTIYNCEGLFTSLAMYKILSIWLCSSSFSTSCQMEGSVAPSAEACVRGCAAGGPAGAAGLRGNRGGGHTGARLLQGRRLGRPGGRHPAAALPAAADGSAGCPYGRRAKVSQRWSAALNSCAFAQRRRQRRHGCVMARCVLAIRLVELWKGA